MRDLSLTAANQVSTLLAFPETREVPANADALTPALSRGKRGSGRRVLIGGVGYTCLGDFSVGPTLIERLSAEPWPAGVAVEDVSYGPIDVLFKLQASPPFDAAIFVTATARDREPGALHRETWIPQSLPPDEFQSRVAEAITGVISLENLLHILHYFGALPPQVVVLEIEPQTETWGTDFSPPVLAALDAAETAIRTEVQRILAGDQPA